MYHAQAVLQRKAIFHTFHWFVIASGFILKTAAQGAVFRDKTEFPIAGTRMCLQDKCKYTHTEQNLIPAGESQNGDI